jgi:hypothetical protein
VMRTNGPGLARQAAMDPGDNDQDLCRTGHRQLAGSEYRHCFGDENP